MTALSASRGLLRLLPGAQTPSRSISTTARRWQQYHNATPEAFSERVISGDSKPIIVDFYADWCGPCRMLSPLLEKLTADPKLTGGQEFDLMTVDTDENSDLAMKYQVTALPTVMIFKDGKPIRRNVGFMALPQLSKFCEDV